MMIRCLTSAVCGLISEENLQFNFLQNTISLLTDRSHILYHNDVQSHGARPYHS